MRYLAGGEEDGRPRGSEYALQSPEGPSERTFCWYGGVSVKQMRGRQTVILVCSGTEVTGIGSIMSSLRALPGGGGGDHLGRLCYVPGRFLWLIGINSGEAITTQLDPPPAPLFDDEPACRWCNVGAQPDPPTWPVCSSTWSPALPVRGPLGRSE